MYFSGFIQVVLKNIEIELHGSVCGDEFHPSYFIVSNKANLLMKNSYFRKSDGKYYSIYITIRNSSTLEIVDRNTHTLSSHSQHTHEYSCLDDFSFLIETSSNLIMNNCVFKMPYFTRYNRHIFTRFYIKSNGNVSINNCHFENYRTCVTYLKYWCFDAFKARLYNHLFLI